MAKVVFGPCGHEWPAKMLAFRRWVNIVDCATCAAEWARRRAAIEDKQLDYEAAKRQDYAAYATRAALRTPAEKAAFLKSGQAMFD